MKLEWDVGLQYKNRLNRKWEKETINVNIKVREKKLKINKLIIWSHFALPDFNYPQ